MAAIRRVSLCAGIRLAGLFCLVLLCGCAGPALETARTNFYIGRYELAAKSLQNIEGVKNDRVLSLMERGMVRQCAGQYAESSRDFILASDLLERLETYSVSRGAASMMVNDTVQEYRGFPFERTLLHVFTAKNHLAGGYWDNAAVEARRIIRSLTDEKRGAYPEDAYSRYMAGFCLEMIDDFSNASLQYRKASGLMKDARVEEKTGRIIPAGLEGIGSVDGAERAGGAELVCFIVSGRVPARRGQDSRGWLVPWAVHGEIYCKGRYLGRSYTLADTADLAFMSGQLDAARDAVKTVARIAVKEKVADAADRENELFGALARMVLMGLLEKPDAREWETLPRWLGVARVQCPSDISEFDVVFKTSSGVETGSVRVKAPLMRRRNIFVSFCRDLDALRSYAGN